MSTFPPPSLIGIAIRIVPVTIIVILSFPAWLTWPFLSKERRTSVIEMVHALGRWTVGDTSDQHDEDDQPGELASDVVTGAITSRDVMGLLGGDGSPLT
jgi:hypothetical protein